MVYLIGLTSRREVNSVALGAIMSTLDAWANPSYCWIVICKNARVHRETNMMFGHKIPLGETDAFEPLPVSEPFWVRCDDCPQPAAGARQPRISKQIVVVTATVDLDCACVGGGGNCPTDAKKQTIPTTTSTSQTLQPTNGRVVANVSLPISLTDASCTAPQCGSGQTTKLIKFATEDSQPTFTVCIAGTPGPTGECTCDGAAGDLPETINCGPQSGIVFPGKKNSCSSLFP